MGAESARNGTLSESLLTLIWEGYFRAREVSSRGVKMNNPHMEYAGPRVKPVFFENVRLARRQ